MLSIIIPTYNERENIRPLIDEILAVIQTIPIEYEILIIDDNSKDGTQEVSKQITKQTKTVHLHNRAEKKGIGSAYKYGFKKAKGTLIMQIDADFSHNPKEIPYFLDAMNNTHDVIIGSRFVTGGKRNDPFTRRIFPLIGSILYRNFLNSGIKDVTSGYRLYKKSALKKVNLNILPDDYSFQAAIIFSLINKKCTIKEIPIIFNRRRSGEPKYNTKALIGNIRTFLRLYHKKINPTKKDPQSQIRTRQS